MNAKISSTFILKSAKTTSKGLIPIYMRVTVDGKRFEISTQKQVEKSKWLQIPVILTTQFQFKVTTRFQFKMATSIFH